MIGKEAGLQLAMTGMRDNPGSQLAEHLRLKAPSYFPEFGSVPISVNRRGEQSRVLSSLYRFDVRSGSSSRSIIIKLPSAKPERSDSIRPRLKRAPQDRSKLEYEHSALRAIQAHFTELDDPRFGSIRILDFIPALNALVMEESSEKTLKDLLAGTNRFIGSSRIRSAVSAVSNSGAWLRSFHSMSALPGSTTRNDTREEFSDSARKFCEFIGERGSRRGARSLLEHINAAVERHLPESLPTAMGHGDFAPRNIFVGPAWRVRVIDTLGAWRPAIFEDIGFFIGALSTSRIQAYTLGVAMSRSILSELESAFLNAYFAGDRIPHQIVNLFAIQSLLDKWCAHVERFNFAGTLGRWKSQSLRTFLVESVIRREITHRLRMLD